METIKIPKAKYTKSSAFGKVINKETSKKVTTKIIKITLASFDFKSSSELITSTFEDLSLPLASSMSLMNNSYKPSENINKIVANKNPSIAPTVCATISILSVFLTSTVAVKNRQCV